MRAPAAGTGGAADALSPGPGFATRPCVVNLPAAAAMQVFRQAFLQKGRQPAPQRPYISRRAPPLPNPSLAPQRARLFPCAYPRRIFAHAAQALHLCALFPGKTDTLPPNKESEPIRTPFVRK